MRVQDTNPVDELTAAVVALLARQPQTAELDVHGNPIPALREVLAPEVPTWSTAGLPFANVWGTPGDIDDGDAEMTVEVLLHGDAVGAGASQAARNLAYTVRSLLYRELAAGRLGAQFGTGSVSVVDFKRFYQLDGENAGQPYAFIATVRLTALWLED